MNAPLKAVRFEDPLAPHVRAMLEALGENPQREGLLQTPSRYAKAMRYLAGGYAQDVDEVVGGGVFAAEGEGAVVVRDIEFHSMCEHHLLPFYGRVHVGYLPARRIIGLSKIPRIVRRSAPSVHGDARRGEAAILHHHPGHARRLRGNPAILVKVHCFKTPDAEQRHGVAVRG